MSRPTLKEGHIKFSDNKDVFTVELVDGINGLRETGSSPSTLNLVGGGNRYGDFEPVFSHFEQNDWSGGRGNENFTDDKTRFSDSKEAWTWGDKVLPAPKWRYARGMINQDMNLPDSMTWKKLKANTRFLTVGFSASASYDADRLYLWIRRRGTGGTLTCTLCADGTGKPGTVLQTVTKTITNVTDTISEYLVFDWSSTQALVSGTTYYINVYGASTDNGANHWEIGCDASTAGYSSSAGSVWVATTFSPCYRVVAADTAQKWMPYVLEGGQYIVNDLLTWGNSSVYINGNRGKASAGAAGSITDSGQSWTADRYIGAWVKITAGTGIGQARTITDNDATSLTISPNWNRNPDNTSEYVIYKTPWWSNTSIGTTGLGHVSDVAVADEIAYFAQGSTAIRRSQVNADTHDWAADGSNTANYLHHFYDSVAGPVMWRALAKQIARANTTTWGSDLSFGTAIKVGTLEYSITNIGDYNNALWVTKEDSIWTVDDDVAIPLNVGLYSFPSEKTGKALASHGLFLYFSWWKSIERLYGGTLDDVGPWHGEGLPSGREGTVVAIVPMLSWLFVAIDAGSTGYSTVLLYRDGGYHEVYRAPYGESIRNIFVQNNDETNPWLWINVGGELVYQEYTLSPLSDSTFDYQHEYVIVSSTHDAGHADTYKFWKDLSLVTDNLSTGGIEILADYQINEDVGTSVWYPIRSAFRKSPTETLEIGAGKVNKIRYRLRCNTSTSTTPPVLYASILKGYEVVPVKRLWTMRIKASTIRRSGNKVDGDKLYKWLWDVCQYAGRVEMETVVPGIEKCLVKIEPPTWGWQFINRIAKWVGQFVLTVREM